MSEISDDLDSIVENTIILANRSECCFKGKGKCGGKSCILKLIPARDLNYRWNPNNNLCVCQRHKFIWDHFPKSRFKMYQMLPTHLEALSEYEKPPRPIQERLEAIKTFWVANSMAIIKKRVAPFPFFIK